MNTISNYRFDGVKTEPVYFCRCGVEHTGDYAIYDFGHHMCFHDGPLWDIGLGQFVCSECGKDFRVEEMRSEYDIRQGVRRKYTTRYQKLSWWQEIVLYLQALYR